MIRRDEKFLELRPPRLPHCPPPRGRPFERNVHRPRPDRQLQKPQAGKPAPAKVRPADPAPISPEIVITAIPQLRRVSPAPTEVRPCAPAARKDKSSLKERKVRPQVSRCKFGQRAFMQSSHDRPWRVSGPSSQQRGPSSAPC